MGVSTVVFLYEPSEYVFGKAVPLKFVPPPGRYYPSGAPCTEWPRVQGLTSVVWSQTSAGAKAIQFRLNTKALFGINTAASGLGVRYAVKCRYGLASNPTRASNATDLTPGGTDGKRVTANDLAIPGGYTRVVCELTAFIKPGTSSILEFVVYALAPYHVYDPPLSF